MATKVYDSALIRLIDQTELYITPLKIKYLREFMDAFDKMSTVETQDGVLDILVDCIRITMKQFYPSIKTTDDVEDNLDMDTMYKILSVSAGVDFKASKENKTVVTEKGGDSWKDMDLAKLESEAFLLGIWKDYEELETSLSLPELTLTLSAKRDSEYSDRKFSAALQGVDLEAQNPKKEEVDPWEAMQARIASGGVTDDPNDILSFQGVKAAKHGFGIGMGLDYESI